MDKIILLLSRRNQIISEKYKVIISEEDITNKSAKEWFKNCLSYLTKVEESKKDADYIEKYSLDLLYKNNLFLCEEFSIGDEYYYDVYELFYDLCDEIVNLLEAKEYLTQEKIDELVEFQEAMSEGLFQLDFKLA